MIPGATLGLRGRVVQARRRSHRAGTRRTTVILCSHGLKLQCRTRGCDIIPVTQGRQQSTADHPEPASLLRVLARTRDKDHRITSNWRSLRFTTPAQMWNQQEALTGMWLGLKEAGVSDLLQVTGTTFFHSAFTECSAYRTHSSLRLLGKGRCKTSQRD